VVVSDREREDTSDEISLQPYLDSLARYRTVIGAITIIVGLLYIVGALALFVLAPSERVASLDFRLLFPGAEANTYPNGSPFSPSEIVSAPVIAEVFRLNELQRYGQPEDFKNALFIRQSNVALEMLEAEYNARLADDKLSPVDRSRIESEFRSKRESLRDPSFTITMHRTERFTSLPDELVHKILSDTLSAWARQAETLQGVARYQVPVVSTEVITKDVIEGSDYLVAADRLRSRAVAILGTIEQMRGVPGADTIRTSSDKVTLPEIRARLENLLRFELEPLVQIIRSDGIAKDGRLLTPYAASIAFQLQLEKQEIEARVRAMQASLREYVGQSASGVSSGGEGNRATGQAGGGPGPTVTPQLTESFLERLEKMSVLAQDGEMQYRRDLTEKIIDESLRLAAVEKELAYYRQLEGAVRSMGRAQAAPQTIALVQRRSLSALSELERATGQLSRLYEEISARNLNPAARLVEITGVVSDHKTRSRPADRIIVALIVVLLGTLLVTSIGALVYARVTHRPAAA
jgi:hypothetical protein